MRPVPSIYIRFALLAAMWLSVSCSDGGQPGDAGPVEGGPVFDGLADDMGPDLAPPPDTRPDGPLPFTCDPTRVGVFVQLQACNSDADCASGVKCDPQLGLCDLDPCLPGAETLTLGWLADGSPWGICTCPCTPDDPVSPHNEDSCPELDENRCSAALDIVAGSCQTDADCAGAGAGFACVAGACRAKQAYCVRKCAPALGANPCDAKLACRFDHDTFGVFDTPICTTLACASDADCPVTTPQACDVSKGLASNPDCGGQRCLVLDHHQPCAAATDCAAGFVCADPGTGTKACLYAEGICSKPGTCDLASGLCGKKPAGLFNPAAKIGDPCVGDTDCGETAECMLEIDYAKLGYKKAGEACTISGDCCSADCGSDGKCSPGSRCTVRTRNGYCTIGGCELAKTLTIKACPSGSECNTFWSGGGYCQRSCSLSDPTPSSSCRGHTGDLLGDYECRAWNNFSTGSGTLTAGPVCDFLHLGCDYFSAVLKGDCSLVGETGNPTGMVCRGYDGQATVDPADPAGICLDSTASGAQIRNPLP